jgi:hypothetical protein
VLSLFEVHLVDLLILDGGSIGQRRVATMRVVPRLDELEGGDAGRRRVRNADTIQQLTLQGGEEGLSHRVVVAISNGAHRETHAGRLTALSEGKGGVLTALVGVVNGLGWPAPGESHLQGIQDQLGAQVRGHRPVDDPPAERIQDHR